jgi:hypothetical protein
VHASIYIFYMVLFTGLVAFCIFLWATREDDEDPPEDQ